MNSKAWTVKLVTYFIITIFILVFLHWMGDLTFKNTKKEFEKQYIMLEVEEISETIEHAVQFGKDIDRYYHFEQVVNSLKDISPNNLEVVLLNRAYNICNATYWNTEREELYTTLILSKSFQHKMTKNSSNEKTMVYELGTYEIVVSPMLDKKYAHIGSLAVIYHTNTLSEKISFSKIIKSSAKIIFITMISIVLILSIEMRYKKKWMKYAHILKICPLIMIIISIFIQSALLYDEYNEKYKLLLNEKAESTANYVANILNDQVQKGVPEKNMKLFTPYFKNKLSKMDIVENIEISNKKKEIRENEVLQEIKNTSYFVILEKNNPYIHSKIQEFAFMLLIILIIFVIIAINLVKFIDIVELRLSNNYNKNTSKQIKGISTHIYLISFTTFMAIYASIPYSTVIMRKQDASILGLNTTITASLPLTIELLVTMAGTLIILKLFKNVPLKIIPLIGFILVIVSNIFCFYTTFPIAIIFWRAISGLGVSFLKYFLNLLCDIGASAESQLDKNVSLLNAGMLGGITIGGAIGAVISNPLGYQYAYMVTCLSLMIILILILYFLPWRMLQQIHCIHSKNITTNRDDIQKGKSVVFQMLRSKKVLKMILLGCIPLNIGLMYIVVFIPLFIEQNSLGALSISYAYLINGIAGIYIGTYLYKFAKKLDKNRIIFLTMMFASMGILILVLENNMLTILLSSALLGIFDCFGVPSVTSTFTLLTDLKDLKVVNILSVWGVISNFVQVCCPLIYSFIIGDGDNHLGFIILGIIYFMIAMIFLFDKKMMDA